MDSYEKLNRQITDFMLSHEDVIARIKRIFDHHMLDKDSFFEGTDGEYIYLFVAYRGIGQYHGGNVFFVRSALIDVNDMKSFVVEKKRIVCKDIEHEGFSELHQYLYEITGHVSLYTAFYSYWWYRGFLENGGRYERLVWQPKR